MSNTNLTITRLTDNVTVQRKENEGWTDVATFIDVLDAQKFIEKQYGENHAENPYRIVQLSVMEYAAMPDDMKEEPDGDEHEEEGHVVDWKLVVNDMDEDEMTEFLTEYDIEYITGEMESGEFSGCFEVFD